MAPFKAYSPVDASASVSRSGSATGSAKPYVSLQQSYQAQPSNLSGGARQGDVANSPGKAVPIQKPAPPVGPLPLAPAYNVSQSNFSRPTKAILTMPNYPPNKSPPSKKQPDTAPSSSGFGDRATASPSPPVMVQNAKASATQAAYDDFAKRCEHMPGIIQASG